MHRLFLAFICWARLISAGAQEPPGVVVDEDVIVTHAEPMSYPLEGRAHVSEGAVVVQVQVGADGRVISASALSGPKLLIDQCVSNARRWTFERSSRNRAVIVYLFRIRGACDLPCPSNFEFYPPNVVVVTIGRPFVTPEGG